jgi:hypothetical protein
MLQPHILFRSGVDTSEFFFWIGSGSDRLPQIFFGSDWSPQIFLDRIGIGSVASIFFLDRIGIGSELDRFS